MGRYSHYVKDISSTRTDGKVNPYHAEIIHRKCFFSSEWILGSSFYFGVEPSKSDMTLRYFRTSALVDYNEYEDGTVVVTTKNSIYTFSKLSEDDT